MAKDYGKEFGSILGKDSGDSAKVDAAASVLKAIKADNKTALAAALELFAECCKGDGDEDEDDEEE